MEVLDFSIGLWILLPVISFLYASVGHGGASGYLALMALFAVAPDYMKPISLSINIIVATLAAIQYCTVVDFPVKLFLWVTITSVPMAFVGGQIHIDASTYKILLGCVLFLSTFKLLFPQSATQPNKIVPYHPLLALSAGGLIGLLSGMIGMGGGILLSPLLLLLRWTTIKQTAAISAVFIVVNSIAGLAGNKLAWQWLEIHYHSPAYILFVFLAILGGFAGSYAGAFKLHDQSLRILLALVLIMACFKLWFTL